ncbi:hypothetical protein D3C76_1648850 [compost metagenome]
MFFREYCHALQRRHDTGMKSAIGSIRLDKVSDERLPGFICSALSHHPTSQLRLIGELMNG